MKDRHAIGLEQLLDAVAQLLNDLVFAVGHRGIIKRGVVHAQAHRPGGLDAREQFRRGNQGLGGDAPPVQASAPQLFLFHQRHGSAQLRGPDRRGVTTGSGANHHYIERCHRLISSRVFRIEFRKRAAKAPSIKRWSVDRVIFIIDRITT